MPKLALHLPDGAETVHELTEDIISIGRLPENTIQIDDPHKNMFLQNFRQIYNHKYLNFQYGCM